MNLLPLSLGSLLLVIAVVDLIWTTLWVNGGAGPLASRLSSAGWGALRTVSGDDPRVLRLAGPFILSAGLVTWVSLLWFGWTFLFASADRVLLDTVDPSPVGWVDRFYFVGYAVFTMGNGDFSPVGSIWQIATGLTTASGMLFITLAVSYVVSVLDAVGQKRSFAASVTGLGGRGDLVVISGWNSEDLDDLELPVSHLISELNTLTTNHKSYPILHYFYSSQADHAPAVAVPVLDEALTILRFGIPEGFGPNTPVVRSARSGVEGYLATLREAFINPAETPPPPRLDELRQAGVPTVSDEAFEDALGDVAERRSALRGLVHSEARCWPGRDET